MTSKATIEVAKTRESWIDDVKMFAILCVVVSHCFHFFSIQPYNTSPIRPFVNAFNMHLFALISSINAYRGVTNISGFRQLIAYIEKLTLRIALPCVGFSLLYRIVQSSNYESAVFWLLGFALLCCFAWFFTYIGVDDCCKYNIINRLRKYMGGVIFSNT